MSAAPAPPDDGLPGLLTLLQLSDSAFPSGRYTLSHGLEAYAAAGAVSRPRSLGVLSKLLVDTVTGTVARSDGVAMACAHRAVGDGDEVDLDLARAADRRLSAVKLVREVREASQRTGRALAATVAAIGTHPGVPESYLELVRTGGTPGNHAVVLGLAHSRSGVAASVAIAGELYSFCAGWATAAVRLGLTDHRGAQRLIHAAAPVVADAAREAARGEVDDISACSPLTDVMSMRHEVADVRLFST